MIAIHHASKVFQMNDSIVLGLNGGSANYEVKTPNGGTEHGTEHRSFHQISKNCVNGENMEAYLNDQHTSMMQTELNLQLLLKNWNCNNLKGEHLKSLKLSGSGISYLDADFFLNLVNLSCLNLSFNNLEELPTSLCRLDNLNDLNISHNKLSNIPYQNCSFKRLRRLIASHNMFREVPNCLYEGIPVLSYLDLSYNEIELFNEEPKCISYLKWLNLSNNHYLISPIWLQNDMCSSLTVLNLSYTNFDSQLFNNMNEFRYRGILVTLDVLCVSNCVLNLENVIFLRKFKNIKYVLLNNEHDHKAVNHFRELNVFNVLIQTLNMSSTKMARIPPDVNKFSSLSVIDFSNNMLSYLPNSFCNLNMLHYCNLSYNSLSSLPEDIGNLPLLREFYINNNLLRCFPEGLSNMKNLKYLDLYDNLIEEVPDSISFIKLSGVDMSKNYFDIKELNGNYEHLGKKLRLKRNCLDRVSEPKYRPSEESSRCNSYRSWKDDDEDEFDITEELLELSANGYENNEDESGIPNTSELKTFNRSTPLDNVVWSDENDIEPFPVLRRNEKQFWKNTFKEISTSFALTEGHLLYPYQIFKTNRINKKKIKTFPQEDGQFDNAQD